MICTIHKLRTVMKYKSLSLLVAACSMTLSMSCAAGSIRLGDIVNEVVRVITTPSTQATGNTQSTAQATKLDAYLQPMLNGCESIDIEKLIREQRSAINDIQRKGDPNAEGDELITTVSFRNATAFGYPVTKIERLIGYEWNHTKLYFNTDQFVSLRPAFKLPTYDSEHTEVVWNNATGYQYGDDWYGSRLTFDRQNRTILCE